MPQERTIRRRTGLKLAGAALALAGTSFLAGHYVVPHFEHETTAVTNLMREGEPRERMIRYLSGGSVVRMIGKRNPGIAQWENERGRLMHGDRTKAITEGLPQQDDAMEKSYREHPEYGKNEGVASILQRKYGAGEAVAKARENAERFLNATAMTSPYASDHGTAAHREKTREHYVKLAVEDVMRQQRLSDEDGRQAGHQATRDANPFKLGLRPEPKQDDPDWDKWQKEKDAVYDRVFDEATKAHAKRVQEWKQRGGHTDAKRDAEDEFGQLYDDYKALISAGTPR